MEDKLDLDLALKCDYIMSSCLGKQRCIFPAERNHMGIDAVENNVLLILDIISITQVIGGEIDSSRCLKT